WENPEGVPISAILVGGRRPTTIPLVHESLSWNHGVFMGSIMGSEVTAATISDQIGQVRRDPFAMLPFIGYHVGDYLKHWIDIGKKYPDNHLPKIYYVNWFRKDAEGDFLWPGFGDNSRVLKWIFDRCDDKVGATSTPIGNVPKPEDLDVHGLTLKKDALKELTKVDIDSWLKEVADIREYYEKIGEKLPNQMVQEIDALEQRLLLKKASSRK
ncbi:MAG: phosphoenolpyruvate carboxykinase domain-containing protein, partial [Firmicutes bacterium]|nr:phosphoenolpyruvate carboxykinase domain-containing protein [Bacillota bacterium]